MADRPLINPQLDWHLQARICAIDSYIDAQGKEGSMGEAIKIFDVRWNTAERIAADQVIKDPGHFVPYQLKKLYEKGTLRTLVDHPPPPKMSDEKIKQAADILAAGYTIPCLDDSTGVVVAYDEHRHFTSIQQATQMSPELHNLMVEHDVTARYLLDRMHDVCPKLVYSALPIKMELTAAEKLYRRNFCTIMRRHLAKDPNLLLKFIFGDETRIYIGNDVHGKLKVYHYTGQDDGAAPEECRLLNKENMMRLDVVLFVSAVWGCCHVEFLTGTTNIATDGRYTAGMQTVWAQRMASGAGPYKVS